MRLAMKKQVREYDTLKKKKLLKNCVWLTELGKRANDDTKILTELHNQLKRDFPEIIK